MSRVLFILKLRTGYGSGYGGYAFASGLQNSAEFVSEVLVANGIESKVVEVVDNNSIDKEVFDYQPTHVIIEALWVVPEKFAVLKKLHPNVKWIVRIHSELAFLAHEGVAIEWLVDYARIKDVYVAANSHETVSDLNDMIYNANPDWATGKVKGSVIYLPNVYPLSDIRSAKQPMSASTLHVACFGAVRPFKNQLIQAVAALTYARTHNKTLYFHINNARAEQGGDSVLRNLRALFAASAPNQLVEHGWMVHEDLISVLETMDLGMQVSLSETFNIVAADMVAADLPIVVSSQIPWVTKGVCANPYSASDITATIEKVLQWPWKGFWTGRNRRDLKNYTAESEKVWLKYLATSEKQ